MSARERILASLPIAATAFITGIATLSAGAPQDAQVGQGFSFHTGVALINVTATVTDENGRFVEGLKSSDFTVYEDGKPQAVSQFEAERVPVSLGIVLDTSGSMLGEKIAAAQGALHRFLFDLLGPEDEVFLYRFAGRPELVQRWTTDRSAVTRALGSVHPNGATALYDAVAEAVPLAQAGTRRKKAVLILSDGCDTDSHTTIDALHQLIRQTEVLVYAIGIDASGGGSYTSAPTSAPNSGHPVPSPFPGKRPPASSSSSSPSTSNARSTSGSPDRINVDALRAITDDSGGRTEIVVSSRDLDPATARVADELSRQYFLGYSSSAPKDGQWHTIEVVVRKAHCTVRARKGFIAN